MSIAALTKNYKFATKKRSKNPTEMAETPGRKGEGECIL